MEVLSLFNSDTCPKSDVDPLRDLTAYPDILNHIKRKNPMYDNYYDAKDALMKVLEEKKNIIAGVIERRGTKCAIYFRKQQRGETQRGCFIRFVDKIKKKKNRDLFIKIVV